MKSENKKQEKTAVQNNLKIKLMVIGITAIIMFTLTGCHDQMAAVETKSLDFPVPLNDITPKPIPAQLASKVTLNNESDEEISKVNDKDIESPIFREISISQYHKTSMLNLELANKSWTDTYDGKGLPLFKISF